MQISAVQIITRKLNHVKSKERFLLFWSQIVYRHHLIHHLHPNTMVMDSIGFSTNHIPEVSETFS
ncbi:hypothetical protein MANES_07G026450v8 [Manihot esculenta]|uniref:Uncharacterized protein n=1 Tax=Manihot esculenta TaxID=3983 RepID=A0ACB7HF41_MANES|nr:hypothetical protein MANES_07G026450v8 [Manihot esculenta]